MKTILVNAVYTFIDEDDNIFEAMRDILDDFSNRKIILTNTDPFFS